MLQTPYVSNEKAIQKQSRLAAFWARWVDISKRTSFENNENTIAALFGCTAGDLSIGNQTKKS